MTDKRIARRAKNLLAEEKAVGSEAPLEQAEEILEESDSRSNDRNASPGTVLEHRTSDEATPPT